MRHRWLAAAIALAAAQSALAQGMFQRPAQKFEQSATDPAVPRRFAPISTHIKVEMLNRADISVSEKDVLAPVVITPAAPQVSSEGRTLRLSGTNVVWNRNPKDGGTIAFAERSRGADSSIELELQVPGAQRYIVDCYFDAATSNGRDVMFSFSDKSTARTGVQIAVGRASIITPRITGWSPPVLRLRPNYGADGKSPVLFEGCEITPLAK